ncbi:MAG: DUF1801 domain-containing protein [Sulfitobacter sp.]|nr:DUF1801 domain-containing protein [Sulfitobacter sp.]
MDHAPAPLLNRISSWSDEAQAAAWACRTLFHGIAQERGVGPLQESLKWGQPAWRPAKPRTGSTLRMDWNEGTPDRLNLFVDCKTDLAARMDDLYPDLAFNDGRRHLAIGLGDPLPEQALAHLAEMTFCYHIARRARATVG